MSNAEPSLVERLRLMPPERLLHMLAEGGELPDPWYDAIQTIYAERGLKLPPRPSRPIVIEQAQERRRGDAVLAGVGLFAAAVAVKMLEQTWVGLALGVGAGVYYVVRLFRYTSLSDSERAAQAATKEAEKQGLNDLMRSAADGDMQRVRELLAFRAVDINARSQAGGTALIYAARNGHTEIVEILLAGGADPKLVTHKNRSAASVARKAGHTSLADMLQPLT